MAEKKRQLGFQITDDEFRFLESEQTRFGGLSISDIARAIIRRAAGLNSIYSNGEEK